jgi:acyl transferase domain-containing protein/acyl-CoA synthetase (AMP-forming)/AMP-acid ligase II
LPVESTSTILTLLETQVANQPDAVAVTLLHNGETIAGSLTYRQLAQRARRIAAQLLRSGVTPGERVLLVYTEGLEFLPALLGCLYAGVVAVPTPAPDAVRSKRALPHMQAVYADAQACGILTTERLKDLLPATPALPILTTDDLLTDDTSVDTFPDLSFPTIHLHQLAYLQYTSGSTGMPKGVMISHANVVANLVVLNQAMGYTADSVFLTWLPHTHDFGLVAGLLRPLTAGVPCYIMPPGALLRRPLRWLTAISRLKVTHSGGATFAYQQCLEQFHPDQCPDLDLSHWRVAVIGAEPIRATLLEEFATTFAPYGFARNAFCPGYGLAETTLIASVKEVGSELITRSLTIEAHAVVLTGCGHPWADGEMQIVDPVTHRLLPGGEVGEIWVAGASVSPGYWNRLEETRETFGNMLNGNPYLRTGDLGLLDQGTLFVTGRLKDLLIIHGQNYFPQDIEWSLEAAHPLLKDGSKAAFAIEEPLVAEGAERLAIVCEIDLKAAKNTDLPAIVHAIRERVGLNFALPVHAIALIRRGMLPKTPSGKVQRRACRTAWLNDELEPLFTWQLDRDAPLVPEERAQVGANASISLPQTPMEALLAQIWCEVLQVPAVSVTDNFFAQGGNSLLLVSAYNTLCEKLGRSFPLVDLFAHPDIRSLARHLSGQEEVGSGLAQVQARIEKQRRALSDESRLQGIAVIGLAGRFPGASSVADFWANLQNGVESIRQFTDEELLAQGVGAHLLQNPAYVKAGAVLDNIDTFDASFFGMSPREAAMTDPQQRLLLECAWEACEAAGYDPQTYPGAIGIFAGAGVPGYMYANLVANQECWNLEGAFQVILGNEKDFLATRTSYRLGLRGPSITVQTACSTSLVATHLACQSLLNYECDMALAGGVSLQIPHKVGYLYQEGGIFSLDGHCRAFDADAGGTIFGSGAGIVLLKRLEDAVKDGDTILAVIKGTAINNDGATKVGFTAPSVQGQAEAIAAAVGVAGVPFNAISYVETHGTATSLGDPIEIEALTRAFRTQTNANGFCAIGTLKTNIGHLDAAAGVAGLIKTVLALHHRQLPPSLHFHTPNPHIDFANSPFYVNTALVDWQTKGSPRVAGISAFGMGGTNAHAVVMEAPETAPGSPGRPWLLFPLSARSPKALEEATVNLAAHLRSHPEIDAPDAAYTLQTGRHAFASRRLVLCRNTDEAIRSLEAPATAENVLTKEEAPTERRVVFLFPGQGIEVVNQGRELYEAEPVFRDNVDRCATLLAPFLEQDIRELLYPMPEREEWANEQMRRTAIAQPAIFVFEYALAQLWRAWGVHPAAMIGHSLGEYVAACLSGVFSLADGLRLVAERGRIMQQIPAGAMLAVALPEQEVQDLLDLHTEYNKKLWLAAVNAPRQCILSGEPATVKQMESLLAEQGVTCVRLATSHAFHSGMMQEVIAPFTAAVCQATLAPPQIPYASNVTGTWAQSAEAMSVDYWGHHLRQPVRYGTGLEQVCADFEDAVLLEVGPGTVLTRLSSLVLGKNRYTAIASLPGGNRSAKGTGEAGLSEEAESNTATNREEKALMEALGRLWLAGVAVDWRSFTAGQRRFHVPLPTYPFQRKRHWIEPDTLSALLSDGFVRGQGFALTDVEAQTPAHDGVEQYGKWATGNDTASGTRKEDISDWFYVPHWTPSRLLPPFVAEAAAGKQIDWIVFADGSALSAQLIQRLQQNSLQHNGGIVVEVHRGARYQQQGQRRFTISPSAPHDYVSLIQGIAGEFGPDLRILHLWNIASFLDSSLLDPPVADPVQTCQELGFYSVLNLTRALQAAPRPNGRVSIVMVTRNLCDVSGDERLEPEKATLLGPCMVIPQENPDIHCSCVDITPTSNQQQLDWLADQLLAESGRATRELLIAYRGRRRWLQDYQQVSIPGNQMQLPSLNQEKVYLITGGMGEIGLALAEHLGRTAHARVILLGRTQFPPRNEWEDWLKNHPETDPMSVQLQRLIALEHVAAGVSVLSADVAEPGQLRQVVDLIYEQFGVLHGVFHAAGIVRDDNAFLVATETTTATTEMHFRPKIRGLQALEQALRGRSVDFCVLFGSNSAVLGGFGFSAYAAGNAFMNAFATDRSRESALRWICVNWDAWRTASLPTLGMPADLIQNLTITEAEGMAVLDRVLPDYPSGSIVVSATDLSARLDLWVKQNSSRAAKGLQRLETERNDINNASDREHVKTPYVAPTTDTERIIVEIWQDHLGIVPIGIQDDFFALGGDSLLAVRLMTQVQQRFQQTLLLKDFVFNPTVVHLAAALDAVQVANPSVTIPVASKHERLDPTLTEDEDRTLRQLYDQLGQPEIQREQDAWNAPPPLHSSVERTIKSLPPPVAYRLLRWLVRLPWVQQKYWTEEVATIVTFHNTIDTPVDAATMVENSLFYNLLVRYGFNMRYDIKPNPAITQIGGLELLQRARDEGRGVILAGSHNLAFPVQFAQSPLVPLVQVVISGIEVHTIQRNLPLEKCMPILFARYLEIAVQALQRGEVVLILPDGDMGGSSAHEIDFHGRRFRFYAGFAELALLTGAPILPMMGEIQPGKPTLLRLLPPLDTGDATMPHAARVERMVTQYEQLLYDNWRTMPWGVPWMQMHHHWARSK